MASTQLVVFNVNSQEFGIDISYINGILRAKKYNIEKVPNLSPIIEGIINLRGNVNYIFNMRKKFKIADHSIGEESKIIMVYVNDLVVGFIVDEVTDIVKLSEEDIQPVPPLFTGIDGKYITGIGKFHDKMISILNPVEVLSNDEANNLMANAV